MAIGAAMAVAAGIGAFGVEAATVAISVAVSFGLQVLANVLGPGVSGPRLSDLTVQTSTYGNAINRAFGSEIRFAGNVIWSTGLIEHKHKKGGFLTPKVTTYTYSTSLAASLCERSIAEGPIEDVLKSWANGGALWDSVGGSAKMGSLVIYRGDFAQLADPTIEAALGMADTPAYRGTAYVVITDLQLADFGNRIPNLEFLVVAKTGQTLGEVATTICAAAGIDAEHNASTTQLSNQAVGGYVLASAMNCWDALKPLQAAYDFEASDQQGQIRFLRRVQNMRAVIPAEALAGHAYGDARPVANTNTRDLDTTLPQQVAVSFMDPDRDYQTNSQSEFRQVGDAQSNIAMQLPIAMPAAEARSAAARILWEQWEGRGKFQFAVTDAWRSLEAGRIYGVVTALGVRPARITRRSRGANGIIMLEATRDESSAYTFVTGGAGSVTPPNVVSIPGPVNPPIIFEPPSTMTGGVAQVWIAVSGGDGTSANPGWKGCDVYVSTDDATFTLIGSVSGPATQGVLTANLAAYGGANPDTGDTLSVSTVMSGEPLVSVSAGDASRGLPAYYVDGEFVGVETIADTGADLWDGTGLWRGLYASTPGAHLAGSAFACLDEAIFIHELPEAYVHPTPVPLFYRFVGKGEALAGVTSYSFTPAGVGFPVTGGTYGDGGNVPVVQVNGSGQVVGISTVPVLGPSGTATTSEAITGPAAGQLYASSGAKLRNANATDGDPTSGSYKPCNCIVVVSALSGAAATYYLPGQWIPWAGLTPGATYWLDTTSGAITTSRPSASGNGDQVVGVANAAGDHLFFDPQPMLGV